MVQNERVQKPTSLIQTAALTPLLLFGTVSIIVFSFYALTLAPGVVGGDGGEHQFVPPLLGIPHATGYPLYVLVGKLWTLLIPIGTMAWRMNLFSAVGGALAAGTTALIVYRLTQHRGSGPNQATTLPWASGFVAGLVLALGLTLWQWSIIAGVRSFTVLFFAAITLEAIIWQQQRQRGDVTAADRTLRWLALTVGLSLTHHRTTVFYLPSLIGWVWWHDRRLIFQPKRWLVLLVLSVAPLALYLFTYLRGINNPPYSHERITDLPSFWFLVGAGDSSGLFFSIDPAFLPARLAFIGQDILDQLSLPGASLAILGALWLLRRYPGPFLVQGLLVLFLFLFTLDFEVVNLNEAPTWYLMPAYLIFAVWLGVGAYWILEFGFAIFDWLRTRSDEAGRRRRGYDNGRTEEPRGRGIHHSSFNIHHSPSAQSLIPLGAAAFFIVVLVYFLAWPNWQQIYSDSIAPLDEWRQLLRGQQAQRLVEGGLPLVEPDSLILGDWEQFTPFRYYQLIDGQRPDVTARLPLDGWPEKVAQAHAAGQPVYFTRKTADLIGTPYLSMAGPLIHLQNKPRFDPPSGITPLNANFENELELLGYRAEVIPQQTPGGAIAGPIIQLSFFWRVPHPVEWNYALSLRLLDPDGQVIYQRDATHPVLSSYPTTLWTPGEVVGDFYELPFPAGTGPLTLHLLPYRTEGPGQWHNLTFSGSEPPQEGILLGPFEEQ